MIRRLRRRHLTIGVAVLALAPIVLVLGLRARPTRHQNPGLSRIPNPIETRRIPGLPIEIVTGPDRTVAAFRATGPIRVPDPLLYWVPAPPQNTSLLPTTALLLGSLSSGRLTPSNAPAAALGPGGFFLVWDGGHGRALKWAPAELLAEGGKKP
jgi:hypothetical protein